MATEPSAVLENDNKVLCRQLEIMFLNGAQMIQSKFSFDFNFNLANCSAPPFQ